MALNRSIQVVAGLLLLAAGVFMQTGPWVSFILSWYEEVLGHRMDYTFRHAGFIYAGQVLMITGLLLIIRKFFFNEKNLTDNRQFIVICYLALFAFFFYRIVTDAVNVPIWDDYGTSLDFADKWCGQASFFERIKLVAAPFYESRMIALRTLNAFLLLVTGEINFKCIILVNDVLYILIVFFLMHYSKLENRFIYYLPFCIFMLQFQSYDCLLWATSGFNFIFTMLSSMAAFIFILRKGNKNMILAMLCALLATITYGNGWIVWIILLLYLLLSKNSGKAILVAAIMSITAILYFNGPLHSPSGDVHETDGFNYIIYYFVFCGSAFRFFNSITISMVAGIMMHVLFILLCKRKYFYINPLFFQIIVFVLLSGVMTTFFRTVDGGTGQALSPRYGFYSQLLFICLLIGYTETTLIRNRGNYFKSLLFASIAWQLLTGFMFYPEAVLRKNTLMEFIKPWKEYPGKNIKVPPVINPWIFGVEPEKVISRAIETGVYHP